jgi:hypothetical protein
VDTQSEDPPEDDLQQAASKLPKVPISILHRSRTGAPPAGLARPRHVEHAGRRQQEQGRRPVSGLRKGE